MDHCIISKLEPGLGNPRICVRLSRMWNFNDPKDDTSLLHVALALVDETEGSIAAQIFPLDDKLFKPLLSEGKIYYLTHYIVRNCSRSYKPVSNSLAIAFTRWTVVEEYVNAPTSFPFYTYSLKSFNQLSALLDSKDSFTDTIGVIIEVSSITFVRSRTRDGDSLKRNVFIRMQS
jgi:replication factor A1